MQKTALFVLAVLFSCIIRIAVPVVESRTLPEECEDLDDPALSGQYEISFFEYGHKEDQDARTTDISPYFNSPQSYVRFVRRIHMDSVPLHGVGYIPKGKGPFPLVLIVHGNHSPRELSYPGYDYLTSHLATHGMIAVSIEEDFLNGSVSGEMDARAIVLLRHLQLFREWNQDQSHQLYGRVNMASIGLAGHSRGGEAVGAAWFFNTHKHDPYDELHDFNFTLRSLFAIAPVDGQISPKGSVHITLEDVDYFIMHGSHDGDVDDFQGMQMYDRALPVNRPGSGEKGMLFVQGANHSQWNEVWAQGDDPRAVQSDIALITAADQQQVGLNFITAWFAWTLQEHSCYRLMASGELLFNSFPQAVVANRQYQAGERLFIDHYEEDSNKNSASLTDGINNGVGLAEWFDDELIPGKTHAVFTAWDTEGAYYRVDLPPEVLDGADEFDMLAFRVGQIYEPEDVFNVYGQAQDFLVRLVVDGTETEALPILQYRPLVSPARVRVCSAAGCLFRSSDVSKTIQDTVRIPLEDFNPSQQIRPAEIEAVIFEFAQSPSGFIAIDEIQFTKQ